MESEIIDKLVIEIKEGNESSIILLYNELAQTINKIYERDYSKYLDKDELYSCALTAIYLAAQSYNPSKSASFKTYAMYYIKGELLAQIEENSSSFKFPVKFKKYNSVIREIISDYWQDNGGEEPTDEKIKELLLGKCNVELSVNDIAQIRNLYSIKNLKSLNDNVLYDVPQSKSDDNLDKIANIASLDDFEKELYYLRHNHGYSIKEISDIKSMSYNVIRNKFEIINAKIERKKKTFQKEGILSK